MAYEFHYTPTGTGVISGKEVLEQTEDAINDLGNTAISGVQEALDKAEQALTNSENAVDDAQTALNTANNAEGVAIQAQNDVSNLSGTVTNIGNRVTTAEGNISNLQGRMTTAEGNITNLQGRMTTAETNIGNLQTAVSTAQATANSAQQTATTARQQAYVLRYSSSAITDNSTIAYSTLDNTDNIKADDKIIDVDGKIFSVVSVDSGNSTVTVGTALIDLAQDSDVVHKSGNETIAGVKTFSDNPVFMAFDGIRFRCAHNSNAYVTFRNSNQANPGSIILSAHDGNVGTTIHLVNKTLIPYNTNDIDLGTASKKWKSFNGLAPSALGMPDLANGIDISSYITHLDKVVNNYTPPSNGWLSIRVKKTSLAHTSLMMYQTGGLLSSCEITEFSISGANLPVIANKNVEIYIIADYLVGVYFYPCQGNV